MAQSIYTILNLPSCKTNDVVAITVMGILADVGIDAKMKDVAVVEKPDRMPLKSPLRFFTTVSVPSTIGTAIDEVLKERKIIKVNSELEAEDFAELKKKMSYDEVFTHEVLRLGTLVVRDWMPTSRRGSIRNDGDAISYESPRNPAERIRILPEELRQDHRFQEVAHSVFGNKARQVLRGY